MTKIKYTPDQVTMVRVNENDEGMLIHAARLARFQGLAHDTNLPDVDDPAYQAQILKNFKDALTKGHVEIWVIESPIRGAGAVFLSPLQKDGEFGIQIDDIVVHPDYRGQNLGTAMIQLVAHLAQSRKGSFVAWECEENNPATALYQSVSAIPRGSVKPFRLSHAILQKIMATSYANEQSDASNTEFTTSSRFSLFRTLNHGIEGYDMDANQQCHGLQIENLKFTSVEDARNAIIQSIIEQNAIDPVYFVDIVVNTNDPNSLALIASFDAEQNTYSGNPAFLWHLTGEAFKKAAEVGSRVTTNLTHPIQTQEPSR